MPIPLLPIIGAATGVAGTAGGVASSFANNEVQRANKKRLEELERLDAAGKLGLNPVEQQQLQAQLYNPVQRAAAEGRVNAEKMQAAMGTTSAADLADLRQQQVRTNAAGARDAAMAVRGANEQKKVMQQQEMESRRGAKAQMKADDIATIMGALSKGAAAGGAIAGAPEGTFANTALALGGMRAPSTGAAGFSEEELALFRKLRENGQLDGILSQAKTLQGGM